MLADLTGTSPVTSGVTTPGQASYDLRKALIDISKNVDSINDTFNNSFSIISKYDANLS